MSASPSSFFLVCVGPNCGERGGKTLVRGLRDLLIERGEHSDRRVAPVQCFGQCATGPNACAWPNGAFVTGIDASRPAAALDALGQPNSTPAP